MRLKKNKTSFDKIAIHPLQSRQWAEFRRAWGNEVLETKYGIITLHKIPFTKYKIGMFIKGPEPRQEMLTNLKILAKEKNLIFIKLEPNEVTKVHSGQWIVDGGKTVHRTPYTVHSKDNLTNLLKNNGCVRGNTLFT